MNFKVYKSSAGSGKTFTLVKEYLSIALSSDNPSNYKTIMAVTFTNKAANEMKERVVKYLRAIGLNEFKDGGENIIHQELLKTLNISEACLQSRAKKTLNNILHHYSDFHISTIDKFILKIIRSFSLDFQIPFNFDVEMDTESILNQAVEHVIAEAGENKALTSFLLQYVTAQAEDDQNWNVTSALTSIAKTTLNDDSSPYIASLQDYSFQDFLKSQKKCEEEVAIYESKINHYLAQGQKVFQENYIEASELIGLSRGHLYKYFHPLDTASKYVPVNEKTISEFEKELWSHKKCPAEKAQIIAENRPQLHGCFLSAEKIKSENNEKINSLKLVKKHLFQLALINEIQKQIQALKQEKNFIHIAEFNQKVAEIVVQQPIPFIYERIGERFQHYLVDEFQDTSELQWQNLMPLIENSLAKGKFNLIVGDVKQAIYRWRGGNVDQFQHIEKADLHKSPLVRERAENITRYLINEQLTTNYRSLPQVINFNNVFFKCLLKKLTYDFTQTYYSDYHQEVGTEKKGGYVEIVMHDKEKEELNPTDYFLTTCHQIVCQAIKRGKNYQDIAILARKNAHLEIIGQYLNSKGIAILSSVSLSLGQSVTIQFIMAVFKLVNNPDDLASMVKITEFLYKNEEVSEIQQAVFKDKALAKKVLKYYIKKDFDIAIPEIHNVGLYDAIENIIRTFDLNKNDPFIQKILDIANAKQDETNLDFIEWWELKQHKTYISSPESINAVKLMTIHKAKGLEFPVVIYPFANPSDRGKKNNLLWTNTEKLDINLPYSIVEKSKKMQESLLEADYEKETQKEILDELNTTYVALTRAVEELYILITSPAKNFEKKDSVDKSNEFFFPVLPLLQEQDNSFTFGEKPASNAAAVQLEIQQNQVQVEANKGWKDKIKLSYSAPTIWNVPQTSEDDFNLIDPRQFGNLIHAVISKLPLKKAIISTEKEIKEQAGQGNHVIQENKEISKVLDQMISAGLALNKNKEAIAQQIQSILALPILKEIWNKGEHIIERDFIHKDGQVFRPDRIILSDKNCYLMDFKTGAKHKKHRTQIAQYAQILRATQYHNIIAYLIYTDPAEQIKVDV